LDRKVGRELNVIDFQLGDIHPTATKQNAVLRGQIFILQQKLLVPYGPETGSA
jgi:hypothetical protein